MNPAAAWRDLLSSDQSREVPVARLCIVTQHVRAAIVGAHFEVAMFRGKPPVENLRDHKPALAERECTRLLLTAVARMAFDEYLHVYK